MTQDKILQFAKAQGYDGAEYDSKWHAYDVYQPTFDGVEIPMIGLPFVILVKDGAIRMSTKDEAFEYLDYCIAKSNKN